MYLVAFSMDSLLGVRWVSADDWAAQSKEKLDFRTFQRRTDWFNWHKKSLIVMNACLFNRESKLLASLMYNGIVASIRMGASSFPETLPAGGRHSSAAGPSRPRVSPLLFFVLVSALLSGRIELVLLARCRANCGTGLGATSTAARGEAGSGLEAREARWMRRTSAVDGAGEREAVAGSATISKRTDERFECARPEPVDSTPRTDRQQHDDDMDG